MSSSHSRHIAALLVLATAVQGWMLYRNKLPAQDAVGFIEMARRLARDPLVSTLRDSGQHPLYPALVSWHQRLLSLWMGANGEAWLRSAQWTAALACVLLVVPMYRAGRHVLDPHLAFAATALFSVLPIAARMGADATSESTYLLFWLLGFWGCLEFLAGWRARWLLLAGAGSGLAYLARPEGLILGAAAGLMLALIQLHPQWRCPWRTAAGGFFALTLGTLSFVLPYAVVAGGLTPKPSLTLLLHQTPRASSQGPGRPTGEGHDPMATARAGSPTPITLPPPPDGRLDFAGKPGTPSARFRGHLPALQELIDELVEGLHYVFGLFVLLGLTRWRRRPVEVFPVLVAMLFTAAVVQFASRSGYISTRHVVTFVGLGSYAAAQGGWILAGWLARLRTKRKNSWESRRQNSEARILPAEMAPTLKFWILTSEFSFFSGHTEPSEQAANRDLSRLERRQLRFGVALMVLAVLFCAPKSFKPLHPSRLAHLEAGRWLARHALPEAAILDTRGWAALLCSRPAYGSAEAESAFHDPRLGYVVLESEELQSDTERARTFRHLLGLAGQSMAGFSTAEEPDTRVLIFRWDPQRLAALATSPRSESPR